jgi:hypothetical protein
MSQTVYTDLGPGQIVASETTRGRTQYKVAGDFGEVWLDAAKVAGQFDLEDDNEPAFRPGHEPDYQQQGQDWNRYRQQEQHNRDWQDAYHAEQYPDSDYARDAEGLTNADPASYAKPSYEDMGYNSDFANSTNPTYDANGMADWGHDGHYGSSDYQSEAFDPIEGEPFDANRPHYFDELGRLRHHPDVTEYAPEHRPRQAWAPVDHENSVNLPYNPTPQYPAIPGDTESTIQPNHEIDADDRLHPSDSITLEDRGESEAGDWPGPSSRNFAGAAEQCEYCGGHGHDYSVHPEAMADIRAYDRERQRQEFPFGDHHEAALPNLPTHNGLEGDPHELHREWMDRGEGYEHESPYWEHIREGSVHEADFDPDAAPHVLDDRQAPDLSLPQQNTGDPAVDGVKPGGSKGKGGSPVKDTIKKLRVGPGWDSSVYASNPRDRAGDAWRDGRDRGIAEHGRQDLDDEYPAEIQDPDFFYDHRNAGLDDRYAELMMDADFHNNPVAQFRHDPEAFINRVGHVSFEGHNPRMAEYMDLVEANANIREAAWADVRKKAMRLRAEGKVHTEDIAPDRIYASVEGDTGTYETMISKKGAFGGFGGGHSISNWHCSCEWGKWAFQRRYTYVGRLCSHGYATYLTMQSAHMTGQPRQQRLTPYPKRRKRADALQMEPQRLVPEMVVNDTEDEPLLTDVTDDERQTTGPDGIVHFSNLSDAEREILAQREINERGAYRLAEDQHNDDWKVEDAADGGRALNEIRDWADKPQEDDLGHMDRRIDEIRDAVQDARDAGTDADQLVASLHFADDQDEDGLDGGPTRSFGDLANGIFHPGGGPDAPATPGDDPWTDAVGGGDAGVGGIGGYPAGDPSTIGGYGDAADTTLGGGNGETPTAGGANNAGGPTDNGNPSGGAAGGGGNYTVKPGDTLTDIIHNQGSGSSVNDVAQASGISDPNMIHPGDTIKGLGTGGGSSSGAAGVSDPSGGGTAGDAGYSNALGLGGSGGSSGASSGASNPASPSGLGGGTSIDDTTIGSGTGSSSSPTTIGPGTGSGSGAAGASDTSGSGSMGDSGYKSLMSARDYHDWHVAAYGVPPRRTAAPAGATTDDTDGAPPPADLASSGSGGESPSATKKPTDDSALAAGLSDTGNGGSFADKSGTPSGTSGTAPTNKPVTQDGMGGASGIGLPGGGLSGLTNMLGQGAGGLSGLSGLLGGGGLSGIGSEIGNLAGGIGGALSGLTHLFGSNDEAQNYREWHVAAYGTEPPQRQAAYPEAGEHHPFNGSGWPGDLEIGSSEDAMKGHKYEDVTDLNNTDYAGSPEALRTGGISRVGKGPQRPPVEPEVIHERRPRNNRQTLADVHEPDDFDPLAIRTAADFDDPADVEQAAVRTAAAGGDIVAQFQASGGGAVTANTSAGHSNDDIAGAAAQFLHRTAGRRYSPAEQDALMREGDRGGARNLDELRLEGTHYSMNSVGLL